MILSSKNIDNKNSFKIKIEILMNTLCLITITSVLLKDYPYYNLSNLEIWIINLSIMFLLLIFGLNKIIRILVSSFAISFFFKDLFENQTNLFFEICALIILYIGIYFMFRRKFSLDLISNSLAIANLIKHLYIYWTLLIIKFNQNFIFYGFIIIFFLLVIPIIEDLLRFLIASMASILMILWLFKQITILNFLIFIITLFIYLLISFDIYTK